jgi:hypothetical protein
MNNAVEIAIRNGYTVNFYKLQDDVFMEVINREGIIINNIELSPKTRESLENLMG